MRVRDASPALGTVVDDLDLREPLSDADAIALRRLLAERYLAHLADDAEYVAPYYPEMPPRRSRAEIASMFDGLFERFTAVSYEVTDAHETVDPDVVICEVRGDNQVRTRGDNRVRTRGDNRVRMRGDNLVTGAEPCYRNHYVMFVRFRDGLVVRWTEYADPNVYHRAVDGV